MDPLDKVKGPAISLLIFGCLSGAAGFIIILSGLMRLFSPKEALPTNDAERLGYLVGTVIPYGIAAISVLAAPVIVVGAMRMLKGRSRTLAQFASVLAMLPLTSCCFIIGFPVAVWSLIILRDPNVTARFDGPNGPYQGGPPQPPLDFTHIR